MNKKEYIEKEIVVDYLNHKLCSKCQNLEGWTPEECEHCLATEAIYSIKMANTTLVAPIVKGEWTEVGEDVHKCTVCKSEVEATEYYIRAMNFCPNCGAAMTEEAVRILAERKETVGDGN